MYTDTQLLPNSPDKMQLSIVLTPNLDLLIPTLNSMASILIAVP